MIEHLADGNIRLFSPFIGDLKKWQIITDGIINISLIILLFLVLNGVSGFTRYPAPCLASGQFAPYLDTGHNAFPSLGE